jgi:hypothetical protein
VVPRQVSVKYKFKFGNCHLDKFIQNPKNNTNRTKKWGVMGTKNMS